MSQIYVSLFPLKVTSSFEAYKILYLLLEFKIFTGMYLVNDLFY